MPLYERYQSGKCPKFRVLAHAPQIVFAGPRRMSTKSSSGVMTVSSQADGRYPGAHRRTHVPLASPESTIPIRRSISSSDAASAPTLPILASALSKRVRANVNCSLGGNFKASSVISDNRRLMPLKYHPHDFRRASLGVRLWKL